MNSLSTLDFVNWLVQISDRKINIASFDQNTNCRAMAELLVKKIRGSNDSNVENLGLINKSASLNGEASFNDTIYHRLREFIGQKQWVGIIIPSGINHEIDEILCDPNLLHYLLESDMSDKGLIIQLDESPKATSTLFNIHPIVITALNEAINWPGILLVVPGDDSVFLPLSSLNSVEIDIEARLMWLLSTLNNGSNIELGKLRISYRNKFPEVFEHEKSTINILHLSGLHIGSKRAKFRMPRIQQFIRLLIEKIGETTKTVPVITGNLMDTPSEQNINAVRSFWSFLTDLGIEEPLLVLGDNDVRKDGNVNENYLTAIGFPLTKIIWHDEQRLGIICINTVLQGNLLNGSVSHQQLAEIEHELSRKNNSSDFKLIAILHHHPVAHEMINVNTDKLYKQLEQSDFGTTIALENADLLTDFVKRNSVAAILHGHSRIPLFSLMEQNIPVVGCGDSIGFISDNDRSVYFSVNIVTFNILARRIACRFLIYRKPEGGLNKAKWHEIVYLTKME